eukprot:6569213-Alexandrium_andersonii.AAC.1
MWVDSDLRVAEFEKPGVEQWSSREALRTRKARRRSSQDANAAAGNPGPSVEVPVALGRRS